MMTQMVSVQHFPELQDHLDYTYWYRFKEEVYITTHKRKEAVIR